jgi:hypothetical protein
MFSPRAHALPQVFLPLRQNGYGKLSWEKGAKPMPLTADGKPDATLAIDWRKKHIGFATVGRTLKKIFRRVIKRRNARGLDARYNIKKVRSW